MPLEPQAMPQRPMAVSNKANPSALIVIDSVSSSHESV